MNFVPEDKQQGPQDVPYFDDVNSEGGWQGHTTRKTIGQLKSEIMVIISRLGGLVTGFQKGTFQAGDKKRDGFVLHYIIEQPNREVIHGQMDIAALPVRNTHSMRRSYDSRREKSLKMALFMLRNALEGTWFLQQLSPGYAPLMPWVLAKDGKTISQLWSEQVMYLLPADASSFVDGEIVENE